MSDKALFEPTVVFKQRKILVTKAKTRSFEKNDVCTVARQGYKCSDKAHVFYQILNGVSGFHLYYYSFKPYDSLKCASKVNEQEEGSDVENGQDQIVEP